MSSRNWNDGKSQVFGQEWRTASKRAMPTKTFSDQDIVSQYSWGQVDETSGGA